MGRPYDISNLIKHYEDCLEKHGDCPKGMDWPNEEELERRFKVMSDLVVEPNRNNNILDLGCGSGLFYDYLERTKKIPQWNYTGIDMSEPMIELAKKKRCGVKFLTQDVIKTPPPDKTFDYVILNGVLTEKHDLSQDEMILFAKDILRRAFVLAKFGIAFNVMSKNVEWERDDLFHWGLDDLTKFLSSEITRHFIIRNDYGLFEYTTYAFHETQE